VTLLRPGDLPLAVWNTSRLPEIRQVELIDNYVAEHGMIRADGEPQPCMRLYVSLQNSARLALQRLEAHLGASARNPVDALNDYLVEAYGDRDGDGGSADADADAAEGRTRAGVRQGGGLGAAPTASPAGVASASVSSWSHGPAATDLLVRLGAGGRLTRSLGVGLEGLTCTRSVARRRPRSASVT
jgi:hypothetical protein